MSEIKILIVEDDPIIALDIASGLNNVDFAVAGIAHNVVDAKSMLQKDPPDLVLLDINLEADDTGIDLAHHINKYFKIPFIYLTSYTSRGIIEAAKKTEPSAYIVKPFTEAELFANIEIGLYNYSQKQTPSPINIFKINPFLATPLSQREFEVIQQIIEGKTNQQMAESLCVSLSTIKTHISNIFIKTEVTSRTGLLAKLNRLAG